MGISLSDGAAREVNTILTQQIERLKGEATDGDTIVEELFLRVGVKGGGCSGFNYTLDLTDQSNDEDEVFEHEGIKIVCDPRSYLYLNGVAIDFRDEMMGRGFVFSNPNATSTCGCGSSFTP